MIDILEAENRIGELFIELGLIPRGDEPLDTFMLDWPVAMVLRDGQSLCWASVYEDFTGSIVLRVDATVAIVDDSAELRAWITEGTNIPFVSPRLDPTDDGRVRVSAVQHLLADAVTKRSLEHAVESIDLAVRRWVSVIERTGFSHDGHGCRRTSEQPATEDVEEIFGELESMVGLASVKSLVRRLVSTQTVANLRARNGLKALHPSPHLVFTGNPGTGKTSVARHIGRLYRAIGILSKGHVIEVDRSDLIAGYVGQTALKTKSVLESASGGVLFIDEAYSLVGDDMNDYGSEAVEMILTHMENNRGDVVVVAAGYPEKMAAFMDSNPGLASRFDNTLVFPDFSDHEMERILVDLAEKYDYRLSAEALVAARAVFARMRRTHGFGNAREVRKLFHEAVAAHSEWVVGAGVTAGAELSVLGPEHLFSSGRTRASDPRALSSVHLPGYL